jgi:hypothetical protein
LSAPVNAATRLGERAAGGEERKRAADVYPSAMTNKSCSWFDMLTTLSKVEG